MAEVTNELIFEVLKAMQLRLSNIEHIQAETRTELRAIRGHLNAMQTDIANLYNSVDVLGGRVARIEQRLDLAEAPVI